MRESEDKGVVVVGVRIRGRLAVFDIEHRSIYVVDIYMRVVWGWACPAAANTLPDCGKEAIP